MKIQIELEAQGLAAALAELLPAGLSPTSVSLTRTRLRIEGTVRKGIITKSVALVAEVATVANGIQLRAFDVKGAMGFGACALADLHQAIAKLDTQWGPLRVRGEKSGVALTVTWA